MKMPKFSIIIPVYNVASYLRECLDSVLAQSCADWEAVCVDDGSTDGSGAILDEYAAKDGRFRVIHQKNAGVGAARNAALNVVRGEWVCFLDADDKVECNWIFDMAGGVASHPEADWLRFSYRDWFEGEEPKPWSEKSVHHYETMLFTDVTRTVWEMMAHGGMICMNAFPSNKISDLRFDESIWFAEDACFLADYMWRSKLLLTIPNDDYRYRMRHTSATHVVKSYSDTAEALGFIMERWKKNPGQTGAFTPSILRHMYRCRREMSQNDNAIWLAFMRRAWRCGFFSLSRLSGFTIKVRWLLYLLTGRPQFIQYKFGLQWLLPYKWSVQ